MISGSEEAGHTLRITTDVLADVLTNVRTYALGV